MIPVSVALSFLGVLAFVWWTRWLDLRESMTINVDATLRVQAAALTALRSEIDELKNVTNGMALAVGLRKLENRQ